MPSSKFNRHPTPRLRPAICFPPPGSCRKTYTVNQPEWIVCRYKWKDWHPPVPVDWYGHMQMPWVPEETSWRGTHVFVGGRINVQLWRHGLWLDYTLTLSCFIEPDQNLWHIWYNIPYFSNEHIDTGNLTMINQPGTDYREARAVG